jgi:hypothetical protein
MRKVYHKCFMALLGQVFSWSMETQTATKSTTNNQNENR